jgi:hypothetical protein
MTPRRGGIVAKPDWDGLQSGFYDFLSHVTIVSKDEGRVQLEMYDAQRYFFDEIFDGLRRDIHWFVCGKGRQLGITTACLLFDVFYAGAVPDVQAGFVVDTDSNKQKFRKILKEMITSLPASHRLPIAKGGDNREGLTLANGNMLDYLTAGTKRGQGTLGRSRALNFVHATECRSYGDEEALESFKDSLSEIFPWRLYLWESTGYGYNLFYDLWEDAVADEISKQAIFVSWWRKRTYSYRRGTALFQRYGWKERSKDEREAEEIVLASYGHKISDEQWAWYRHRADPIARAEERNDDDLADDRQEIVTQEHPHFPEQMFRGTGSPWIPNEYIAPALHRAQSVIFRGYHYHLGDDVSAMTVVPTKVVKFAQLKVYEPPSPIGVYIIGADTAFGISDRGDANCAEVFRCFADRMVQVAEFNDRNIQPFQFAWVLLHLCGWYGNCRYVLELNGSGEAVWTELKTLKRMVEDGRLVPPRFAPEDLMQPMPGPPEDTPNNDIRHTYQLVTQYLYRRADSLGGGGYNYHMRCLSIDEVLPTPEGWVRMEDVSVSDRVFDDRGRICHVTAVSDIKRDHDCYRLTFDDGSSIVADAEHLWPIDDYWPTRTIELRPDVDKIRVAEALDIAPKDLRIHPYVLGVWLGDGGSAGGHFFAGAADASEMVRHLQSVGAYVASTQQDERTGVWKVLIHDLHGKLSADGLLHDKHIPQQYLRGSRFQREELLRGLMDTDGTIGINSDRQCSFTTTNLKIAAGFAELLRTLGIKPHFQTLNRSMDYRGRIVECAQAYQFWFTGYPDMPVFKLHRKRERQLGPTTPMRFKRSKRHRLVAVDPVPSVPVRCISVDSPGHLYLAGIGMIPTHNTSIESKFTMMTQFADRFMLGEATINSVPCLEEMKRMRKDGRAIEAESKAKDDRPIACGLVTRAYIDDERKKLVASNQTYATEMQREADGAGQDSLQARYMAMIMQQTFADKGQTRRRQQRAGARQRWNW